MDPSWKLWEYHGEDHGDMELRGRWKLWPKRVLKRMPQKFLENTSGSLVRRCSEMASSYFWIWLYFSRPSNDWFMFLTFAHAFGQSELLYILESVWKRNGYCRTALHQFLPEIPTESFHLWNFASRHSPHPISPALVSKPRKKVSICALEPRQFGVSWSLSWFFPNFYG